MYFCLWGENNDNTHKTGLVDF